MYVPIFNMKIVHWMHHQRGVLSRNCLLMREWLDKQALSEDPSETQNLQAMNCICSKKSVLFVDMALE